MPKATLLARKSRRATLPRIPSEADAPLALADPCLEGSRVQMRAQNEERLRAALRHLAPLAPVIQSPHHMDHDVSRPILSFGDKSSKDAGRWYQRVSRHYFTFDFTNFYHFGVCSHSERMPCSLYNSPIGPKSALWGLGAG